jgi:PAS domain S-box-containing protein
VWINRFAPEWNRRAWPKAQHVNTTNCEFWTVCHQLKGMPPETTITIGTKEVAQPGSVSVFWSGTAPWREPKDAQLQFSYRLDDQSWSPFTLESGHAFFTLASGRHHLEVRARDLDYNVDPSPAALDFVVLPPVWRQGWFIALVLVLAGAIVIQSLRVFRERSLLRITNRELAAEIDERGRAEAAARQSEEVYRSFVAASPDGVAVIGSRGSVEYASNRIYELLGTGLKDDAVKTSLLKWLVPEEHERAAADLAAIANGQVINGARYTLVRQDGSRLPIELSAAPVLGTGAPPPRIVAIVRDATGRLRTEEAVQKLTEDLEKRVQTRTADVQRTSDELKNSQRALMNIVEDLNEKTAALANTNNELEAVNKELEAFSYSVSHDLRAPLRGIDGFSQALLEDYRGKLDDEGQHYLRRIRSGAQRMAQLIDDMLNLSRVSRGEMRMEKISLSNLAQEIANDLTRRDPQRKVSFTLAPDMTATGDTRLLRIAMENLLGNAWKFTSKTPEAKIEFGLTLQEERPVHFVRDNGAGFDMTYANRLFGAFQRLHTTEEFPGTGVGLATVQRIIHRHGGRIWAESKVGGGATFFFTLQ